MSKPFYGSFKHNYSRNSRKINSEEFSLLSEPINILGKDVKGVDNYTYFTLNGCVFYF